MSKRFREIRLSRLQAAQAEKPAAPDPPATTPDPPATALYPAAPALEPIEKFAKEAHDLDVIRKSVEDATSVSGTLWFSYLFTLFYFGIAAGGVTHKDLLLESPVKLPFLGVDLPLIAFFFLAPIIFIVSHAYTLVHFVMLAAKVGGFKAELRAQLPGDAVHDTREGLRRQLPSNIFVQFLAGPGEIRKGGLGLILKVIAWISLVIGPVLLLLLIQIQFLPYHLAWVTWVQRVAIFADVILLWFMWPAVLNGRSEMQWPPFWRYKILTLASLILIGLAFTAATFPGEWMDEWIGQSAPFHDLLFGGETDIITPRHKSLFSNTLVVPNFDALEAAKIYDSKKLDSVKRTVSLRGRHLEGADFFEANLRKADMEGAHLQGASLTGAELQGARLLGAQLQGASLTGAQLQGASLSGVQLQGASLPQAQLQGSSLDLAQLQFAWLTNAQLQGASLDRAQLQGASFDLAELEGASLEGANLEGALLVGAQLQGANFQNAILAGTDMGYAAVWRTTFDGASLAAVFEVGLKEGAISKDGFAALKADIMKEVPESAVAPGGLVALKAVRASRTPQASTLREDALERIEKLNPDIADVPGFEAKQMEMLGKHRTADFPAHLKAWAVQLKILVCSGDKDARYALRGLVTYKGIVSAGPLAPGLIESILAPDCPVSASLTKADKAALKKLAEEAQPGKSKP